MGLDLQLVAVVATCSLRLPTEPGDDVVAPEEKLADPFAAAGQLASSPRLAKSVDRRFNEALRQGLVA